ncbi:MAG: hypothetical protein HY204_03910 [Nitrospirae bacterium]|nr:hypothetical protein [Nitrospirota bacterium]
MVNMLVVNRHVMVPKPFTVRLKKDKALKILKDKMGIPTVTDARLDPLVGHWHWARGGDIIADIAAIYGVVEADILANPKNVGLTAGVLAGWRRIWIPEDNVDLFEAYVKIVLEDIGLTVHFIDDWDVYHRMDGEVHCGTNAKRTPPEAIAGYAGPFWWDFYERLAEL